MQASFTPASLATIPQGTAERVDAKDSFAQQDLDAFAGDRSFVMSFARGVSVIHAFAHVSRPLTIAEVTHRTQIPRAAVRRLLHTLCELGYVKLVGLRYQLTPKTLELGNAFTSSNNIAVNVQPIVSRLAEQLHAFCALLVPEDDETMLMCLSGTVPAAIAVPRSMAPAAGNKAPLYASASGLLFLAAMTEAQLDAYFLRVSMRPFTFRTQTESALVRESLRRVRSQGYAMCDRTFSEDLRSIAVPVHNGCGAVVGAMAAVVTTERLGEHELHSALLPALLSAAHEAKQRWK